tara:strand:- start:1212 stop:1805 length:594 start_codon:yes stop_codon:yes gene_type:complete
VLFYCPKFNPTGGRVSEQAGIEHKAMRFDFKSVGGDGTFEGYASLFGAEDLGRDMVMPGAFRQSLRKRGHRGVKLLYQHDPNEPIGIWTKISEDARGLFVQGRLLDDVARSREVLSLMRAGAIDGLSIGYHVVKAEADKKTGLRRLWQVDLWEISVVTFPMLPQARISAVKNSDKSKDKTTTSVARAFRLASRIFKP